MKFHSTFLQILCNIPYNNCVLFGSQHQNAQIVPVNLVKLLQRQRIDTLPHLDGVAGFSEILDKEDPIEDAYILEVSSPGLGRPLKKDKDFQRNLGEEVEVRTYKPINKQKEFVGLLDAWDKETVTLQLESGEMMTIARADIALIRQYIEF